MFVNKHFVCKKFPKKKLKKKKNLFQSENENCSDALGFRRTGPKTVKCSVKYYFIFFHVFCFSTHPYLCNGNTHNYFAWPNQLEVFCRKHKSCPQLWWTKDGPFLLLHLGRGCMHLCGAGAQVMTIHVYSSKYNTKIAQGPIQSLPIWHTT